MKNVLNIICSTLIMVSCKAQSPIYNITDFENKSQDIPGAYYKDIDHVLDPFVGTYVFDDGTRKLKFVLQKKTMSSVAGIYYEDILIGEYQYIQNGVEIVNTLPKLNENYTNQAKHNISGNVVTTGNFLCEECTPTEKQLRGALFDENSKKAASLFIRKAVINGQEAILVFFYWNYTTSKDGDPPRPNPSFPGGHYTMIKE